MDTKLYLIKKDGFSICEVLLSMTLFILILGICGSLLGAVTEASSENSLEKDGQIYYRVPSNAAFIKAINLNYAFMETLSEADLAIVCNWQGRDDSVKLPETSLRICSSQAFIRAYPHLASTIKDNESDVVLFKNCKLIGILSMELQYTDKRAFGKVTFRKLDENLRYDYGVYFEALNETEIFGIKNKINGYREGLDIECEKIDLNLPNPMAIGENSSSCKFSYAFTCRK